MYSRHILTTEISFVLLAAKYPNKILILTIHCRWKLLHDHSKTDFNTNNSLSLEIVT